MHTNANVPVSLLPPRSPARSGSAIVITLVTILILAGMATVLTDISVSQFKQEQAREKQVFLMVAAESAFNESLDWCQRNTATLKAMAVGVETDISAVSLDADTPRWNVDGFDVRLTKLADPDMAGADNWGDETFLLNATARCGDAGVNINDYRRRRIQGLIRPQVNTFLTKAMFSVAGFDWQGNGQTYSWDSAADGSFAQAKAAGKIQSNGDLGSNGTIDVLPSKVGNIHGTWESDLNMSITLPSTDAPAGATELGAITTARTLGPGTYHASSIDLAKGKALTIDGGTVHLYVDGSIEMGGNTLVYVDTTDRLFLYQKNYTGDDSGFKLTGTDQIGTMQGTTEASLPQQFIWISEYNGNMKFAGGASISCVLVAPAASLQLQGNSDFYGSMIARAFHGQANGEQGKVNASFTFYYDEALGDLDLGAPPTLLITGWFTSTPGPGAP